MTDDPQRRNAPSNLQWGGRFAAGPSLIMQEINASIDFDRKLWRQDIRGSLAHAAMLAKTGILGAAEEKADQRRPGGDRARDRQRALPVRRGAGRHPHEYRGAADRSHRRGRSAPAHRAEPQRPGGDGFSPVGARRDRRTGRAACRPDAGAGGTRGAARRRSDARLYPFADRPARDVRAPLARLCRDVFPRSRPAGRLPAAAERVPARRRGAGRHVVPDRPGHDRRGAGVRPAGGQFAGCRVGSGFRAGVPGRGRDLGDAPVALRRGNRRSGAARRSGLSGCRMRSPPAARSCPKNAIRTRPSWCARRPVG